MSNSLSSMRVPVGRVFLNDDLDLARMTSLEPSRTPPRCRLSPRCAPHHASQSWPAAKLSGSVPTLRHAARSYRPDRCGRAARADRYRDQTADVSPGRSLAGSCLLSTSFAAEKSATAAPRHAGIAVTAPRGTPWRHHPPRARCSEQACCVAAHRSASPAPKHHAELAAAHTARSGTAPTAALRAWTQTGCWRAQSPTPGDAAELAQKNAGAGAARAALARSAAVLCHAISAVRRSVTRSSLTAAAAVKIAATTKPPIERFCAPVLSRCWA